VEDAVVGKIKGQLNERKQSRFKKGPVFKRIKAIWAEEMIPILAALDSTDTDEGLKQGLRKYLVIMLVSIVEEYLMHVASRIIDEDKLDVSKVAESEIVVPLSKIEYLKKADVTLGKIIASGVNFTNPANMNDFFSRLLNYKDFLDVIRKLDEQDTVVLYFTNAVALYKNWDNFMAMFDLRDAVVHGMQEVKLSNRQLLSLCDNVMDFIENASLACDPKSKDDVNRRLGLLARKKAKKAK
jgi:hypothetical protein